MKILRLVLIVCLCPILRAATPLVDAQLSGSNNQVKSGATLTIKNGATVTVEGGATVPWVAGALSNPMTTAGDLITGGTAGAPTRLAIGSNGQVLTVVSGVPLWRTVGGTGTVTSVALTMPGGFSIAGSPITGAGTFVVTTALSGILKGSSGAFVAATPGTDYEAANGNPGTNGYLLASTTGGTRSWVVPGEPALGNPGTTGFVLSSTTGGTRSWVAQSAGASGANPTASIISNSAINGSAGTFMRSDAAPAIATSAVFQLARIGLGGAADGSILLKLFDATDASSTSTGTFTTAGGIGVAKRIWALGLTVDTTTLSVDSTNHRVGVGTASPGVNFDIVGTAAAWARVIRASNASDAAFLCQTAGTITGASPQWNFGIPNGANNFGIYSYDGSAITNRLGIDTNGIVTIPNTTASTTTGTGALVISGGLGVGGAVNSGTAQVNDATTPTVVTASGKTNTGYFQVNGKTSGSFKITTADATAQAMTQTVAAQTGGASTVTIPNMAGSAGTFAFLEKAQTFTAQQIIKGSATNDSAASTYIGEIISSTIATASSVTLTSVTGANVTSVSLTAGDWDVFGTVAFTVGSTTTVGYLAGGIGTTTAALPTTGTGSFIIPGAGTNAAIDVTLDPQGAVPYSRISIASTTTVYLVAQAKFGTSTCKAYGQIFARRAR